MQRFRGYGPNDDTPLNDGDTYFSGFWSRYQPTYLKEGQAYYCGNMRLDRGTAKVRAGLLAASTDISLTNPPLVVGSFSLVASVSISSITRVTTTATVTTAAPHGYSTSDRINISGATGGDGAYYNGDFTITKTGASTFTYTMSGTPSGSATGTLLANKGPRVFNTYASSAFGSCVYADQYTNTEGIVIASNSSAYLYRYGQSTITIAYPAGETCDVGGTVDLVQFLNKVYLFRGYSTSTNAPIAVTSVTRSATTATVTTTANHGLSTGNWVTMVGASPDGYNGIVQITVTGLATFTYTVDGGLTTPATGTITARPCKPPLSWDLNTTTKAFVVAQSGPSSLGAPYINMPAVDWGYFFTSRMVLPWSKDQLIMSDILNAGNYDPSQTQFRILPGTNDYLVGTFGYQMTRLLVLYRKSVHLLLLDTLTLANAQALEITRNFGCVARRSIANCGPYICWLSDIGVVKFEISNELNLTNTQAPLSDPINDIIGTINWAYAGNAVATFWNNRYYLAVPTGSQTTNQTVLVYNFLNNAWESVDTYPAGVDIVNFHIMSYNGSKKVFVVTGAGYVSLTEYGSVDQWGAPGNLANYAIPGSLKTRNYLAGTYDIKKVRRFQLDGNVTTGDVITANYVLSNPDYTLSALNYTATSTTDVTLRSTVNRRGVSGRLEIATTSGRPEITAITAESAVSTRATINFT